MNEKQKLKEINQQTDKVQTKQMFEKYEKDYLLEKAKIQARLEH